MHALVHVYEPVGSSITAPQHHICVSRTRVDSTPPAVVIRAEGSEEALLRCASCLTASATAALGTAIVDRELSYAPSTQELLLALPAHDDVESLMSHRAVSLLVADPQRFPAGASPTCAAAFAQRAANLSSTNVSAVQQLAAELNMVVPLHTGAATWEEVPTAGSEAPDGWFVPPMGAWLGATGWNPLLGHALQQANHQPLPACSSGDDAG